MAGGGRRAAPGHGPHAAARPTDHAHRLIPSLGLRPRRDSGPPVRHCGRPPGRGGAAGIQLHHLCVRGGSAGGGFEGGPPPAWAHLLRASGASRCARLLLNPLFNPFKSHSYGQTGTGKTFTMEGGGRGLGSGLGEAAGVIPRAVSHIFSTARRCGAGRNWTGAQQGWRRLCRWPSPPPTRPCPSFPLPARRGGRGLHPQVHVSGAVQRGNLRPAGPRRPARRGRRAAAHAGNARWRRGPGPGRGRRGDSGRRARPAGPGVGQATHGRDPAEQAGTERKGGGEGGRGVARAAGAGVARAPWPRPCSTTVVVRSPFHQNSRPTSAICASPPAPTPSSPSPCTCGRPRRTESRRCALAACTSSTWPAAKM